MKKIKTVEEYIAGRPKESQAKLREIREVVKKTAPKAEEGLSYGIIGFKQEGYLVYVGGFKTHIGMYPTTLGSVRAFPKEMKKYKTSTGTLQFPLEEKLPLAFIKKFVQFRLKENSARQAAKKKKK